MKALIISAIIGYLIGGIPFSFIIARLKGIDIRKVGSGNVGGTNVLRSAGALAGAFAFALDILKGVLAVFIVRKYGINFQIIAGIFAVIGHCFPVYLKFKGGKGVATTFGVFLGIYYLSGLIFFIFWIITVIFTKYVSLSSIIGLLAGSVFALIMGKSYWIVFLALALFSILRHKDNIQRLISGNERKTDVVKYFLGKKGRK
ncbi:glycerol-3-phosphate acyltransferase [Thermosipho ferrireducens]|uniref:Glycerol-3-phosphate acyltransferase n=1 Tax=Thermosipho ferrireducens TaxID=2571116 RepID=A0ABX7S7L0_9BACT|nr:glycerol-3-phosphate 1-O-acyltransferase PlsY [Thermosipho ferrireducens]QTA37263.1 glycerol-3-phosphate acyltransferase [Thermosipho ferrireducens]